MDKSVTVYMIDDSKAINMKVSKKMECNQKVSVIVPVYNVHPYLDRCIRSIVSQSYKKLEIILVDDGSTDPSGNLCDLWAEKDNRIIVRHQKNAGLSAARNTGIKIFTGDYVMFVDSDDWIDNSMIEKMLENGVEKQADIVCCGMYSVSERKAETLPWFKKEKILKKEEALDLLIENKIMTSHVMPKLYKREIIEAKQFPVGKKFEDVYTMHNFFAKCNRILIIPDSFYFYYQHMDSITNTVSLSNRLEWIDALKSRYDDVYMLKNEYEEQLVAQIAVVLSLTLVQNNFESQEIKVCEEKIAYYDRFIASEGGIRCVTKYASKKQIAIFLFYKIFHNHANAIYRVFHK